MHTRYCAVSVFVSCKREASVGLDLTSGLHVVFSRFKFNGTYMNDTAGRESDFARYRVGSQMVGTTSQYKKNGDDRKRKCLIHYVQLRFHHDDCIDYRAIRYQLISKFP